MAAEISSQTGVQAELIEGAGGVFDVVADGAMIFSKDRSGRFPESAEVLRALKEKMK